MGEVSNVLDGLNLSRSYQYIVEDAKRSPSPKKKKTKKSPKKKSPRKSPTKAPEVHNQ